MPLFYFNCSACQQDPRRKIAANVQAASAAVGVCLKCGGAMKRTPKPPTSQVVERLDSPHMVRAVERPADAERLYAERAANDPRNKPE